MVTSYNSNAALELILYIMITCPPAKIHRHIPNCSGIITFLQFCNEPLSINRFTSYIKHSGVNRSCSLQMSGSSYTILCMNSPPLSPPLICRTLSTLSMCSNFDSSFSSLSTNMMQRRSSATFILHYNQSYHEHNQHSVMNIIYMRIVIA